MNFEYLKASGENIWIYLIVLVFWVLNAVFTAKKKQEQKRQAPARREETQIEESIEEYEAEAEVETAPAPLPDDFWRHDPGHTETKSEHRVVESEHIQTETVAPIRRKQIEIARVESRKMLPSTLFPSGVRQAFIASEILGKPLSLRGGRR